MTDRQTTGESIANSITEAWPMADWQCDDLVCPGGCGGQRRHVGDADGGQEAEWQQY